MNDSSHWLLSTGMSMLLEVEDIYRFYRMAVKDNQYLKIVSKMTGKVETIPDINLFILSKSKIFIDEINH
ncbi:hypothetical protein RJT34_08689 [Clitoria ternatea]|uniref:Uncharacterized protein n=1 Tax=Clitoria ternatea TaxID=43366 RepID=A0AAN9K6X6_CLITE